MKRLLNIIAVAAVALLLGSCSAMFNSSTYGTNDLYRSDNRIQVANELKAKAEAERAEAEARQAMWEARMAEINASTAEAEYYASTTPSYTSIVADNYESAYARRLYGFSSPTYQLPSSYYNLSTNATMRYATAYDPAQYNIMISGDQVWVEPKYRTSMFGQWGATALVPTYGWYYGWSRPYYSSWLYGYPRYSWYDWGYGAMYDPYWGWSWGYGWGGYPYHPGFVPPHHHHHYYPPHYGGGSHRRPTVAVRPNSSQPGGRPSYLSGSSRPSSSQQGVSSSGRTQYRGQSGTVTGSGQYRGSSSSRGSYNSTGTRIGNSFNQRNDNNSFSSPSSSSSRGGYSGGYSGGGNYSGGSHGGGQGRR